MPSVLDLSDITVTVPETGCGSCVCWVRNPACVCPNFPAIPCVTFPQMECDGDTVFWAGRVFRLPGGVRVFSQWEEHGSTEEYPSGYWTELRTTISVSCTGSPIATGIGARITRTVYYYLPSDLTTPVDSHTRWDLLGPAGAVPTTGSCDPFEITVGMMMGFNPTAELIEDCPELAANLSGFGFLIVPVDAVITTCEDAGYDEEEDEDEDEEMMMAGAGGPGTELKQLLASLGLTGATGCGCNDMARRMDAWGVEGCQKPPHRLRIIRLLRKQSKSVGWTAKLKAAARAVRTGLVFKIDPRDPAPGLLKEAIHRAGLDT